MDRHDCKNVPRTPARLPSDLAYFELASENWSAAMLAAYNDDLAAVPIQCRQLDPVGFGVAAALRQL